jgi:hypothetical protein
MDSFASKVGSVELNRHALTSPLPSKLKTYGFAIAIIVGIGGLAVGAAGLAGYFHVGALSNMAQVDAIIMMAVGGGGGIILLIIGVVGTVKNRQSSSPQRHGDVHVDSERGDATRKSGSTGRTEIIGSIDTQDGSVYEPEAWEIRNVGVLDVVSSVPRVGLSKKDIDTQDGSVYGPEAWKIWNVKVLDAVPSVPRVDLSKKDKVLLYIPQKIRVHGEEQNFTLNVLKKISDGPFNYFCKCIEEQFGDNAAPGWVLIDKNVIPQSRNENYETQKRMVEARDCSMPSVLEAVVLNLMVFAFTGERLYGKEAWTYTRCIEKVAGIYPVLVGGFGSDGLDVSTYCGFFDGRYGVACVRRKEEILSKVVF